MWYWPVKSNDVVCEINGRPIARNMQRATKHATNFQNMQQATKTCNGLPKHATGYQNMQRLLKHATDFQNMQRATKTCNGLPKHATGYLNM